MLAIWSLAVAALAAPCRTTSSRACLACSGLISAGFLLFTLATSNPFTRLLPPPIDGNDLNPLLQDFGAQRSIRRFFTPAMSASAVAFAFACAAMLEGKLDPSWARWTRPWTIVAWMFLTVGIALGSWWAYYELGWGGWWFWDPVENASFMPWLVGHRADSFPGSDGKARPVPELDAAARDLRVLVVACSAPSWCAPGVLISVHAFASDPERGVVHPRIPDRCASVAR